MLAALRARINASEAAREDGFTLIEILVVLEILAILLTTAVPSFLGFKQRALEQSAIANARTLSQAANSYGIEEGTFVGMDLTKLNATIDGSIDDSAATKFKLSGITATSYCAEFQSASDVYAYRDGPNAPLVLSPTPGCP